LTIPTGSWHFILLQYDGNTGNVQASIDLGSPQQLGTGQFFAFENLVSSGFIFMPSCLHLIFDFRVYNLQNSWPMLESTLQYYYNDVLNNGGKGTLTQQ
jgi:hypothetical protein